MGVKQALSGKCSRRVQIMASGVVVLKQVACTARLLLAISDGYGLVEAGWRYKLLLFRCRPLLLHMRRVL